ncbi:chlorophyll A/B binding protein [Striga asiatica]|uniref:Chlorophyll a-b binding protein, chloroplastic n=1 Tax=Striga asiatica TaxID=4170 RepID=A0A5A7QQR8_STRAF|nr:chlorophyll A/B binding protein [Striga asiatica]
MAVAASSLIGNRSARIQARFAFGGKKSAPKRAASKTVVPDRPLWYPGTKAPEYLDGSLVNLAKNVAGDIIGTRTEVADVKSTTFQPYSEVFRLQRFRKCELIHGRWAMLATLGALTVEWLTGVTWQDAGKKSRIKTDSNRRSNRPVRWLAGPPARLGRAVGLGSARPGSVPCRASWCPGTALGTAGATGLGPWGRWTWLGADWRWWARPGAAGTARARLVPLGCELGTAEARLRRCRAAGHGQALARHCWHGEGTDRDHTGAAGCPRGHWALGHAAGACTEANWAQLARLGSALDLARGSGTRPRALGLARALPGAVRMAGHAGCHGHACWGYWGLCLAHGHALGAAGAVACTRAVPRAYRARALAKATLCRHGQALGPGTTALRARPVTKAGPCRTSGDYFRQHA